MNARMMLPIGLMILASQATAQTVPVSPLVPKASGPCRAADTDFDCAIGLVVTERATSTGKTECDVSLSDPTQNVVGVRRGIRVILQWKIVKAPDGYGFSYDDGIEFVNDPLPRQFAWPTRSPDSLTYWWTNKNNLGRARYFEYEINVRSADGSVRCYLPDRWIKNQ